MSEAAKLARRLADEAERVCRRYLSSGRREGGYWLVGDVGNAPGRSLFVRLLDSPSGPAGKWTDAATGEHGDLLDIIRLTCGLRSFREAADEARRFLGLAHADPAPTRPAAHTPMRGASPAAARRLFALSKPIAGTLADAYLARRGVFLAADDAGALRFHARCHYRGGDPSLAEARPAMIAAVTDLAGRITGVQRTWLDPCGFDPVRLGKASLATPRRALGQLLGHAVRFGSARDALAVGEGIETTLSLRPAAFRLPTTLRRLYVARDRDPAGAKAAQALVERSTQVGVCAIVLSPRLDDFNTDLRAFGADDLQACLRSQLTPRDIPYVLG